MKNFLRTTLPLIIIGILVIMFLIFMPQPKQQVVNCSLVEISPDFTAEHRKECRMIRGTKL
jgi:hypothetical protein